MILNGLVHLVSSLDFDMQLWSYWHDHLPSTEGLASVMTDFFPANRSRAPFVGLERVDPSPRGPVMEGDVDDEKRRAPSWQLKVPVPVTSVGCGSNFCGPYGFYDVAYLSAFQVCCSQHV